MQNDASKNGRPVDRRADDAMDVLLVVAPDPQLDPEEAERVPRLLRDEVAELDIKSIRSGPSTPVPKEAKGADAVTVGAIVVALSASGGVLTVFIETVRDWLDRSSARHRVSLTIDGDTIELERASDAERRDLIDAYIRRHTGA
jgi:hypothetical protein